MKDKQLVGSVVTGGALLALLGVGLLGQEAASKPTKSATAAIAEPAAPKKPAAHLDSVRALKRAGLTEAAIAELRRWVQENPTAAVPDDIKNLLKEIDDLSLSLASAYASAGLRDEARTALREWIHEHPHHFIPKDLESLLDDSLEVIRAYRRAGLFDAAAAELKTWVQKHPDASVPPDLQNLLPSDWDFWWRIRQSAAPLLAGLLSLTVAFGLVALAAIRGFNLWPPSLVIAAFDSSDSHDGLGNRLSTMLRQTLVQPRASTPSLAIASGPVVPDPIPAEVASAIAPTSSVVVVVATLLKWIRPNRILTVSGVIHAIGARGGGLTLTLSEGTRAVSSVTLWQKEFEPDLVAIAVTKDTFPPDTYPAYELLVAPAETWIRYQLRERYSRTSAPWVGSRNWLSHALFLAGLRANGLNRTGTARRLYLAALAKDPQNLPARLNLALLLPDTLATTKAEQLTFIVNQSKGNPADTTYYSAAFSLAMLLAETDKTAASEVAAQLVGTIDNARMPQPANLSNPSQDANDPRLEEYLAVIAPSARVMAAALAGGTLPETIDTSWPTTEFQYNLACYYGMRSDEKSLLKSIEHLEFAAELDRPRIVKQAAADVSSCLKNVSTADSTKTRFAKLLAPAPSPQQPDAAASRLAAIEMIGATRAGELERLELRTAADLIVACSEIGSASAAAQSLGLSVPTLLRWARAAELARLPKLEPAHANAMVAAGFDTLESLKGKTASGLAAAMKDWWKKDAVPDQETIERWVLLSNSASSLVMRPQDSVKN